MKGGISEVDNAVYRKRKNSRAIVYNNTTLVAMMVALFIVRPAKEALIVLLGNIVGNAIYYFLKLGNYCIILWLLGWLLYSITRKRNRHKLTAPTYFMLGYSGILLYSTISMGSYSLIYLFELLGSGLAFFALFDKAGEERTVDCIRGIYYYLTIAMLLNSLTIYFFYPTGVYTISNGNSNYYLFALDNVAFLYEIAALALGLVYYTCYQHSIPIRTYVIHIVILGAYFYSKSATAMIVSACSVLFVVTYKLLYKFKLIRMINFKLVIIVSALIFSLIVVVGSVSRFSWLFELVGKDATFGSRTSIWSAALNIWREHWLFGVGTSGDVINSYLHEGGLSSAWGTEIGHLHNVVLEVLFDGGIAAMLFFLGIIVCSYKKMNLMSARIIAKILCVFFLLQWLSVTFDFRTNTYTFWLIPILMYRVSFLVKYYDRLD